MNSMVDGVHLKPKSAKAPFSYTVVAEMNPFHPQKDRKVRVLRKKYAIKDLAPKTSAPFICFINGDSVLRKDWDRRPANEDIIVFKVLVRGGGGGGGKNPLAIVASLALMVVAPWAAGVLTGMQAGLMFNVVRGLISLAGTALINAVFQSTPKQPSYQTQAETAQASPTYSIQSQANMSRLGSPIPVQYGRMQAYPNLAAMPYTEYVDNDMYLYQLFCIGQGDHDIEQIRIEDTPITSLDGVTYQITPPNREVTLFPTNVVTAVEVAGQELLKEDGWAGPFVINAAGTNINKIAVDMVWPGGMTRIGDHGGHQTLKSDWQIEYQKIDDSGNAVGDWYNPSGRTINTTQTTVSETVTGTLPFGEEPTVTIGTQQTFSGITGVELFDAENGDWVNFWDVDTGEGGYRHGYSQNGGIISFHAMNGGRNYRITYNKRVTSTVYGDYVETFSAATNTPQRRTYYYPVANGRYQIRARRMDVKDTSTRSAHTLTWGSVRGYLIASQNYGNLTMLAISIKASNQLTEMSSKRINVISTRKLPMWSPSGWAAATPTRSIAPALLDILKAHYAGRRQDAQIDLQGIYDLHLIWEARGDKFDGIIENRSTLWEVASLCARVGRAKPFIQGGVFRVTRDQQASVPVMMFTHRNIVKGSFETEYLLPGDDSPDSVIVKYFNQLTWKEDTVDAVLPGWTNVNPATLPIFGITQHNHAWREGIYEAATNRWRRNPMTLTTEMEGHIPSILDLVAVSRDRPRFGQSAEIVSYTPATLTAELSQDMTWTPSTQHYVSLRKRNGGMAGPYAVSQGSAPNIIVFSSAPDATIDTGISRERTHVGFGPGENYRVLARVVSVKPRNLHQVQIELINENNSVHSADGTTPPTPPSPWQLPTRLTRPVISHLNAVIQDSPTQPFVDFRWSVASGASYYILQHSTDGQNYTTVTETKQTNYRLLPSVGVNYVRISAVGLIQGPWKMWSGAFSGVDTTRLPPTAPAIPPNDATTTTVVIPVPPEPVPNVTGLEIFGQGTSTEFLGRDCKFSWRRAANTRSYGMGNEPFGSGPTGTDTSFADYFIKIERPDGTELRTDSVRSEQYTYTYERNVEDNFRVDRTGPVRSFKISVWQRGRSQISPQAATLTVNNPQHTLPTIELPRVVLNSILIDWTIPEDTDFSGLLIWMSTDEEFIASDENLVFDGTVTPAHFTGLSGVPHYLQWAAYDSFGIDNLQMSGKVSVTPKKVSTQDYEENSITEGALHGSLTSRINLIDADASYIGSVAWRVAEEALARVNTDSSLQSQINILSAGTSGDMGEVLAAIEDEAVARADGDAANANTTSLLATQLRGSYTGTDLALVTTGLIYSEREARSTAIASEASARSVLQSSFDTLSLTVDGLEDDVITNAASITDEATTRANADSALSSNISTVSAVANARNRSFRQTTSPTGAVTGDIWFDSDDNNKAYRYLAGSGWIATDDTRIAANAAAISTESTTRANADSSLASQISIVSATANARNRTFSQASTPTGAVLGDLWFDSDDNNKPYRYNGSSWLITDDLRIAANTAAISSEATTRANADSALSSQISTVSATANSRNRTFSQASAPSGAVSGDLWFDTDDNNKAYRHNGSAWVLTHDLRIEANTAAISTEATARANADGSLFAQYTVKVDLNGYISGYGLASTTVNGTPLSEFLIRADRFAIGAPGTSSAYPFIVVGGVVYINSVVIQAASITDAMIQNVSASKIVASTLSLISPNMGNITSGSLDIGGKFSVNSSGQMTVMSASFGARVEMTNSYIKVYDENGVLRVQLGDLAA